jgi:hypothetical protein
MRRQRGTVTTRQPTTATPIARKINRLFQRFGEGVRGTPFTISVSMSGVIMKDAGIGVEGIRCCDRDRRCDASQKL